MIIKQSKLIDKWLNFCGASAQGHLGFLVLIKTGIEGMDRKVTIQHEKIHLMQELELGIVFFYIIYVFDYLVNRIHYGTHQEGYRNIIFEVEAYKHQATKAYTRRRRHYEYWR